MTEEKNFKTTASVTVGLLKIDWGNRLFEVRGLSGHDNDKMSVAEVYEELKKPLGDGCLVHAAVIFESEEFDGAPQLAYYDLLEFEEHVYGPGPGVDD